MAPNIWEDFPSINQASSGMQRLMDGSITALSGADSNSPGPWQTMSWKGRFLSSWNGCMDKHIFSQLLPLAYQRTSSTTSFLCEYNGCTYPIYLHFPLTRQVSIALTGFDRSIVCLNLQVPIHTCNACMTRIFYHNICMYYLNFSTLFLQFASLFFTAT